MKTLQKNSKMLLLLSIFLTSCDCLMTVDGKIVDEKDNTLSDATIYSLNKTYNKIKSDINGKFSFSEINGGAGKCSSIDLVVEKSGYKTDTFLIYIGAKSKDISLRLNK